MRVGDSLAVAGHDEELALDPGAQLVPLPVELRERSLQDIARCLRQRLSAHVQVRGQPADFAFPGQLHQAVDGRHREDVGIGRRHVEPGGEAGEPGPRFAHFADRGGRHQLRALRAEQVRERNEEILDAQLFGLLLQHGSASSGKLATADAALRITAVHELLASQQFGHGRFDERFVGRAFQRVTGAVPPQGRYGTKLGMRYLSRFGQGVFGREVQISRRGHDQRVRHDRRKRTRQVLVKSIVVADVGSLPRFDHR